MGQVTIGELDGVSHSYGRRVALDGVSLAVAPGVTGLVGVNGAGKTTLLHLLATLLPPSSGAVRICGMDPWKTSRAREARRQLALMPQSFVPPRGVTVEEFLHYVAWLRVVPRKDRPSAVKQALEAADLVDRAKDKLSGLSGGMLRRALLGQALVARPKLLLLDEPTTGLDPEQRVRVRDLVAAQAQDRAVLVSSHIMEDVVHVADRIVMLDDGRVIFDGPPADLLGIGGAAPPSGPGLSEYERAFLSLRGSAKD